jgi:hypothetical protein
MSLISDFGKALGTSPWRSHPTLDYIRLETNMDALLDEAQKLLWVLQATILSFKCSEASAISIRIYMYVDVTYGKALLTFIHSGLASDSSNFSTKPCIDMGTDLKSSTTFM